MAATTEIVHVEAFPTTTAGERHPAPPADLLEFFWEIHDAETRKKSTLDAYAADVDAFEKWASANGIDAASDRPVEIAWVAAWAASMAKDGMAPSSIERRVRGLGAHLSLIHI